MPSTHADLASSVDQLLTVRLWALLDVFEQRLAAELAPMGLTISTFRLIGELMRAPDGLSQRELARRLRVKPPSVSAAVTRLVDSGLLVRVTDPDDARSVRVRLASDASLLPGAELLARIETDLFAELSAPRREAMLDMLTDLTHRLVADEETPS